MPSRFSTDELDAMAGAASLNRIEDDLKDEARHADAQARYAAQDARQIANDERMNAREDRIAQSQNLDDEVKRWEFERKKTFDENAKQRAIINSQRAIAASNKLFEIDTKAEDAEMKMGEVFRDYGDLLDKDSGDPRFIGQWNFNQKNLDFHRRNKLAEDARAARPVPKTDAEKIAFDVERKKALDAIKPADAPKPEKPDSYEAFNKDFSAAVESYKRFRPVSEANNEAWLPGDVQKQYDARRSALRSGSAPASTPQPVVPASGGVDDFFKRVLGK